MEKSSQNDPETPFFCHLCSVSCASALNLQSHFMGIKHRKAEEAIRDNKMDKEEPIEIKPNATLQEQIDACKNSEPALGLEYIYQYQKHGYNTYECKLCECRSGLTHMFMHIVGAKHRIYYLGKHHPSLGVSGPYIMSGPKKLKKLKDICLKVEKKFGRQKINILEGRESQWSFNSDITGASSVYSTPDGELEQIDFTTDDYFDIDGKPAASEHVTFLELKAAYEGNQKKSSSKDSITRETEEGKQTKATEKKVKSTTGEPCESDQGFTNNKDLLDFLEHFRIVKGGDVKFVITVIEMLSIALLRHKRVSKENEENKLSVSKSDATHEQDRCKKQNSMQSVSPHASQDPESQSKEELHSVSKLDKSGPLAETNPLTFSESTPGIPKDPEMQSKFFLPISQSVIAERKKVLFTVSSKKAQALQNPVFPAPQVNRRAPLDLTRFAYPQAPFPPRVALPLFPIAKDDIMNKFFESIKNMEVDEVISTLNIITATNPAFKGIHVPSLIHYLRETGKLKSAQSMQQLNQ